MDAQFKEGDEVYYKANPAHSESREKFRVRKIEQVQVSEEIKNAAKQQSLYGKEIEKMSQPDYSFIIEPVSGGKSIRVNRAEIELATIK